MKYLLFFLLLFGSVTSVFAQSDSSSFNVRFFAGNDTTPPSTPTLLNATPVSPTQIDINWSAATDNFSVQGYVLSRGTSTIATTTLTAYSDTGVSASTTYSYTVRAFDASLNYSSSSNSISTTTPGFPVTATTTEEENDSTGSQGTIARIVVRDLQVTPGITTADIAVETARPVRLTVRWGRSSDYELGYSVSEYYTTAHIVSLSDLEPGTTYTFEITAETSFGLESVVEIGTFTTLTTPGASIPSNVSRLTAVTEGNDAVLSWQLPNGPNVAFVRIVRSNYGFPEYPQNGAVVYQGQGSGFTDSNIFLEYSPAYYTAFVYSTDGAVSSGAIAIAFAGPMSNSSTEETGVGVGTVDIPDTPTKVPEATSTIDSERIPIDTKVPELFDIEIAQSDTEYTFIDPVIILRSNEEFTIKIPTYAVAGNLKSIIGTMLDPTNNELSYSFLLRINADGTYYQAVIPALQVVGESVLAVSIYDYQAYSVATYKTPVQFQETQRVAGTVWFPDVFYKWPVNILLLGVLLGAILLVLLLIFRHRHEDKA